MIFDEKEIATNRSLSNVGKAHQNVDLSQNPITSKTEGSIKISLTGRIQVNGGFNQTPVLISFDAIPDESLAMQTVSTELSNSIVAETTINLPDSNAGFTFDIASIIEHANDEASDSLNVTAGEDYEAGRTNTNKVAIKSGDKFFDSTRGSEKEERKTAKRDSRIEKRLDEYSANLRTAKRVFLTDYTKSIAPSGKTDRTNVARTTSERTDGVVRKLDARASGVRFPNILGSVLVDKDNLKNQTQESRCLVDEANRSELDRSNTIDITPLSHVEVEKPSVDSTSDERDGLARCPGQDSRNVTSGSCYRIPATVRKLELPGTTVRESQTSSNYRDSDSAQTFPPDIQEATTNDRNAGTVRDSSSTRSGDAVLQVTTGYSTNEEFPTETPCDRCNDKSVNAIHVRNMMAIVRFMMRLLRIVVEEESPCLRTQVGETVIRVRNVIVNASSCIGNNVGKQKGATETTMISEGEKQNFMTTERRSTIADRIREEPSPLNGDTFEASTLPGTSDEAFENQVSSALSQTSTRREGSYATFSATPKSFLFYELDRKPLLRENASRKNISVLHLMDVEQNSSVSFNDSKEDSGAKESRLDGSQTNRLPQNQDRSFADRFHSGKQEIASTTNFKGNKIAPKSPREKHSTGNKNVGFWWLSKSTVANDNIGPTRVSRDALLEAIDTVREDRLARSRKSKKTRISDRRDTRTKLLNSSGRRGSPEDWIGEHWTATRRLPIDKKLRESREVPSGIAAEKVVLPAHGKINRPGDPNFGSDGSHSVKIEGHFAVNDHLAKLSTYDAPPTVKGDLRSRKRADSSEKANVIQYSSGSSRADNIDAPKIDEELANEPTRFVTKIMKFYNFYKIYLIQF